MKTVDIKGKSYVMVNERIMHFRDKYPQGAIKTEMLLLNDGICVFKAEIWDGDVLVATGHALEKEGSTFINKSSHLENCETSAVGRALGILGIGIDASIASAEEVGNAIANQGKKPEKLMEMKTQTGRERSKLLAEKYGVGLDVIAKEFGYNKETTDKQIMLEMPKVAEFLKEYTKMKFYTSSDKDRKLTNINWAHINRYLSRWVGGTEFVIEIKRHEETESDPQRKWYFVGVLPKLSREVGYEPHEDMLVHDQLKARYFKIEPDKRGVLRGLPSVFSKKSTLTVSEKGQFIEWVLRIAAEYGVYIEDPRKEGNNS